MPFPSVYDIGLVAQCSSLASLVHHVLRCILARSRTFSLVSSATGEHPHLCLKIEQDSWQLNQPPLTSPTLHGLMEVAKLDDKQEYTYM